MKNNNMPLFVQNEIEVRNEDDGPIPANTASTGSIGRSSATECGNRVLEMISRHTNDARKRKIDSDNTFKEMLQNLRKESVETKLAKQREKLAEILSNSSINKFKPLIKDDIPTEIVEASKKIATHTKKRDPPTPRLPEINLDTNGIFEETEPVRQRVIYVSSEEYMNLPKSRPPPSPQSVVTKIPRLKKSENNVVRNADLSYKKSPIVEKTQSRVSERFALEPEARIPQLHFSSPISSPIPARVEVQSGQVSEDSDNEAIYEPVEYFETVVASANEENNNTFWSPKANLETVVPEETCTWPEHDLLSHRDFSENNNSPRRRLQGRNLDIPPPVNKYFTVRPAGSKNGYSDGENGNSLDSDSGRVKSKESIIRPHPSLVPIHAPTLGFFGRCCQFVQRYLLFAAVVVLIALGCFALVYLNLGERTITTEDKDIPYSSAEVIQHDGLIF